MTNTNKATNKVFFILLVVSIILISLRLTPTIQAIKQLAYSVLVPDIKVSSNLFSKAGNFLLYLSNIIKVNQENIELKNEKIELTQQLIDYKIVLEDNARLRNLFNIKQDRNSKPIFANIIVREPTQWYQFSIIDKGSNDGIEMDSPVVAVLSNGQMCVFGRVVELYPSTSKIALITNPLFSVPVQIKQSNIDCVCDGYNDQYLRLSFIPQSVNLHLNDNLVTSQLSDIFDRGINVGKIVDISRTSLGEYQEVLIEPYCQSESIYEVVVLVKNKNK